MASEPTPTCPDCGSTKLVQTGPHRRHCQGCNGLFKNDETIPVSPNTETNEEQS